MYVWHTKTALHVQRFFKPDQKCRRNLAYKKVVLRICYVSFRDVAFLFYCHVSGYDVHMQTHTQMCGSDTIVSTVMILLKTVFNNYM